MKSGTSEREGITSNKNTIRGSLEFGCEGCYSVGLRGIPFRFKNSLNIVLITFRIPLNLYFEVFEFMLETIIYMLSSYLNVILVRFAMSSEI